MKNLIYHNVFLILLLLASCQNNEVEESPEASYLKNVSIESELHLEHLGQITFMEDYVPISDYSKEHMIDEIDLPLEDIDKIDVNIRAYLNNTLTNYLMELAPERSVTELVTNGNYQFTFIVDNEVIYVENLNTGAGSPYSKNQYTSLCVPLLSSSKVDSWGRFMWARFMSRGGGQEALNIGEHNLKIEIRPYIEFNKLIVGDIIAEGNLDINVIDSSKPINPEKLKVQKIQPSTNWTISSDKINNTLIEALNEKIHKNRFKDVTSIVALKNNEIILEEYFNESNRSTLHDTRSVGKSITSTLMGLAISQRHIKDEHETIGKFYHINQYDNNSEEKSNISIKDLLTMTSTFDGSDEDSDSKGSEDQIQNSDDWMNYTLDLPTRSSQEKSWTYFTGGTMILGDIIDKSVPGGLESFAQANLYEPLDIKSSEWFHTPKGLPYGGGGLRLSTLDLAKIGSLYANNGRWKNVEILDDSWIEKSLSNHIELPDDRNGTYGYLWYNSTIKIDGKEIPCSYAAGNGGNVIYVFKELQIVIVITAQAYNTMEGSVQGKKMIEQYILPAIL